ncbi:MAG: anthranilate phosphoribosyltransferase [Pirellulaceae bacterium]|nr:anthranilate phosphoribosyltransferase [Pirellulaceae bacterium]
MLTPYLGRISAGENLTMEEMSAVMSEVMAGRCQDNEIALLLTALKAKGETADEIAGAAQVMRRHMTPIRSTRQGIVDTCGTGGVGSNIFNVSTAAAIVTAAAGVPVAKHGNRSATSKSGSADVLQALGVNIAASVETVEHCLEELGICFCFAPSLHPAMKHVAAVRKQLGTATIFNLLGPLCNPAGAHYQVLGVGKPELRDLMAAVLLRLGTERAVVVGGTDGMGEITITGPTEVREVTPAGICSSTWQPADFGLTVAGKESLVVDGPQASAAIIRDVLSGKQGPPRDIVIINAAAALWVSGQGTSPLVCAQQAAMTIDSQKAMLLLTRLIEMSK